MAKSEASNGITSLMKRPTAKLSLKWMFGIRNMQSF